MASLFKSALSLLFFIIIQMNISQAQDIVGKWLLSDFKLNLNERATPEQKKDYETNKGLQEGFLEESKGKMILEFTAEGSYISSDTEKNKIEKGKWRMEGNKIFLYDEGKSELEIKYDIVDGKLNIMSSKYGMDSKLTLLKQ
jgi:hypothetical protein